MRHLRRRAGVAGCLYAPSAWRWRAATGDAWREHLVDNNALQPLAVRHCAWRRLRGGWR